MTKRGWCAELRGRSSSGCAHVSDPYRSANAINAVEIFVFQPNAVRITRVFSLRYHSILCAHFGLQTAAQSPTVDGQCNLANAVLKA
jgi:hypothetical protein